MIMPQKKPKIAAKDFATLINDAYLGMSFSRINSNMIVSRDGSGNILSLFIHDTWLFPLLAYMARDNYVFSFDAWRNNAKFNNQNIDLCKKIFIMLLYFPKSKSKKPARLSTMRPYMHLLRMICSFADRLQIGILDLVEDDNLLSNLLDTCPSTALVQLRTMMTNLNKIDLSEKGFTFSGHAVATVKAKAKAFNRESSQHPIIPSRILWLKYCHQKEVLIEFRSHQQKLIELINKACANPYYGRDYAYHKEYKKKRSDIHPEVQEKLKKEGRSFKVAVAEHGLEGLAKKYKWEKISSVSHYLSLVQFCARCHIHLLTLMRESEAIGLQRDCLLPAKGWNNEAVYLVGESTKLHSQPFKYKWITIPKIEEPIEILHTINALIAPYVHSDMLKKSLFVSPARLPIANSCSNSQENIPRVWLDDEMPDVLITEEDLEELELIEPWRNWRTDPKFRIGTPWRLTSHQYRRSIAVFAGQSGLMSLPALKRLLQHLTKLMSTYYARGCSINNYMMNLLNPELADEIKAAKRHADAALYIRDVVHSSESLLGAQGSRLMDSKVNVWIHQPPEETAREILKGVRSWSPSPVGGCTFNGPCDRRAHGNFLWCPYCPNCIGKLSVIDETIEEIKWEISELDPGTLEHNAELMNLQDWLSMRAIIHKA